MGARRYRWWHGVLFYAGVQAVSFTLRALARFSAKDRAFYEASKLPVFAPPGVVFPIAWSINNVSTISGGLYVLNLPDNTPGRSRFLRSQLAAWVLFSVFNAAYFGLRSPINAAVVTIAFSGATVFSIDAATRIMHDRHATLSLATTAAWLLLAAPLGVTQALWNRDPFWRLGPFVPPPRSWLK